MAKIVTIAGCTSLVSRASAVLAHVHKALAGTAVTTESIAMRRLPAQDLRRGRAYSAPIRQSKVLIEGADGIVIAASVCKDSYDDGLKAFFDLLPSDAFRGKIILPIVLDTSPLDFLNVDYSLRGVLTTLGANTLLEGVYLLERQVQLYDRQVHFDPIIQERFETGINTLLREVMPKSTFSLFGYLSLLPLVGVSSRRDG